MSDKKEWWQYGPGSFGPTLDKILAECEAAVKKIEEQRFATAICMMQQPHVAAAASPTPYIRVSAPKPMLSVQSKTVLLKDIAVLNADGIQDSQGVAFRDRNRINVDPNMSVVDDAGNCIGAVKTYAWEGSTLRLTMELSSSVIVVAHVGRLFPSVGGKITVGTAKSVDAANLLEARLSVNPNADTRILSINDQVQGKTQPVTVKINGATFQASNVKVSYDPPKPKPVPKVYPRCQACSTEMSPELDAYYGKDPRGSKNCDPCRRRLGIR